MHFYTHIHTQRDTHMYICICIQIYKFFLFSPLYLIQKIYFPLIKAMHQNEITETLTNNNNEIIKNKRLY